MPVWETHVDKFRGVVILVVFDFERALVLKFLEDHRPVLLGLGEGGCHGREAQGLAAFFQEGLQYN